MSADGTSFFVTGGTLLPDARSYVERRADKEIFENLLAGELCYALTSRQMGKSSLMVRTVQRLRARGVKVAVLDLTAIGQNLSTEQWYDGLLAKLGQQLDLENDLDEFWQTQARFGPLQRWSAALEKVILARCPSPIVIFVDELDVVRSLPFSTDEFFAAIRECYNRRSQSPEFQRLSFCLLGVATPTDLIRDPRLTPFNIGRRIELNDFIEAETQGLAAGLNRNEAISTRLLTRVLYWTGGHPYLTQRLCRSLSEDANATSATDVDRHCEELFLSPKARERDDNLIFVRERMLSSDVERAELLDLYKQVRKGKRVPDEETNPFVSRLRLAGIVCGAGGFLKVRNRIYESVFNSDWIAANMPRAELRRQRAAFRRGLTRATVGSVAGLLLLLALATFQRPLSQAQKLPDGSRVVLSKVTYGKHHRFEPGVFRVAWLRDLIPAFRRYFPPSIDRDTEDDTLVFWITRRDGSGRYLAMDWWRDYEVVDEHGCTFGHGSRRAYAASRQGVTHSAISTGPGSILSGGVSGNYQYIVGEGGLTVFPRRTKRFRLRLYENTGKQAVEFSVSNPASASYTTWMPEPLPISKKAGDLEFALTGLKLESVPVGMNGAEVVKRTQYSAVFQITQNGQPTEDWEAKKIIYLDATGSSVESDSGTLCPYEAAWKVRAEFFRKDSAHFGSNELWTLRSVPVPRPGTVQVLGLTNQLQGVSLRLLALAGPGKFLYSNGVPVSLSQPGDEQLRGGGFRGGSSEFNPRTGNQQQTVDGGQSHVGFQFSGLTSEHRVTLRVLDEATRQSFYKTAISSSGTNQFWYLDLPAEAKTVELNLAVHKGHVVEYIVRPPLPEKQKAE